MVTGTLIAFIGDVNGLNVSLALSLLLGVLTPLTVEGVHRTALAGSLRQDADVLLAERVLSELGYWTGPVDGRWDAGTRHALVAFQKVEGRKRTGRLDDDELTALRGAARPTPRENEGPHVEIDLTRQVLFTVDESGAITRVLSISSGNGRPYASRGQRGIAITPPGRFRIERKISGWHRSPLGLLYEPSYFRRGWAIHGSSSVPVYPASHGCIRVPMYAALELSELLKLGTPVLIYE